MSADKCSLLYSFFFFSLFRIIFFVPFFYFPFLIPHLLRIFIYLIFFSISFLFQDFYSNKNEEGFKIKYARFISRFGEKVESTFLEICLFQP